MPQRSAKSQALAFAEAAQAVFAEADAQGRDLTAEEEDQVEWLLASAKAIGQRPNVPRGDMQALIDAGRVPGGANRSQGSEWGGMGNAGRIGDAFVNSPQYKGIAGRGASSPSWSSGEVEIPRVALETKGTLMEGATPGGGPLVQPDVRQGVTATLFQPLTIAGALNQDTTTSSVVRFISEGTIVNAAAPTAEGGAKPEATIPFIQTDTPVRKIAVFLPVSDEMLQDAVSVQQYLNGRLSLFLQVAEEAQLLRGDGNAPNLPGILTNAGIQWHNRGTFTNLDAVRQMLTKARTSYLEPSFVAMHPNQTEVIDLLKATGSGDYFGDPFRSGSNTLWGVPLITTNAVGAGTVLVGSREAATIYRNGSLRVEASNSHSDWFQKDLVALRGEVREALAIFRPAAFVCGTAFA